MTDGERAALGIASRLLDYPDEAFFQEIPVLRAELEKYPHSHALAQLSAFLDRLEENGSRLSCENYVAVFDMDPATSLHMSWHRYGNDRGQGKAMAALNGLYRAAGFEPLGGDMPDYLPVMLEFLAICEDWAAEAMLDGFGPELARLQEGLDSSQSGYGPVLGAALAPLRQKWPGYFKPRTKPDSTLRPMARPEPEEAPFQPLRWPEKH